MISAFVGSVGGGKSFCSVRRMCSYMATGGRCASNIELTGWDNELNDLRPDSPVISFLSSLGWKYQPRQYVYIPFEIMCADSRWFQKIPAGISRDKRTLCVVDEATDLFDSLDANKLRQDSGYRELFHFLRLSRHAHIDVLFIAQDIDSINSRLRGLVANMWKSTDMKDYRIHGFKIKFPFDVFCLQLFDKRGKYELSREWVKKDSRVFGLYQSEVFGGALGVKWDGVSVADGSISPFQEGKKKMNTIQLVVLSAVLLCGFWLVSSGISSGGDSISKSLKSIKISVSSPSPAPASPSLPPTGVSTGVSRLPSSTVLASASAVSTPSSAASAASPSSVKVLRGHYRYFRARGGSAVSAYSLFDDVELRLHWFSEWGSVIEMDERGAVCRSQEGNITVLLPNLPSYEKPLKPSQLSIKQSSPNNTPISLLPENIITNTPPPPPGGSLQAGRGGAGGL